MMEFLKGWILNIVTLVIFIALLEILIPSGKIKKYINLITGFILIIAIITPLLGLLKEGTDLKEFQIASSNFIDKKEIERNSKILKEEQMKQITEAYRNKLIKQLETEAGQSSGYRDIKADVIINEDYKSERFGEVKRVYLYLKPGNHSTGVEPVIKVEKTNIDGDKKIKKEEREVDNGIDGEIRKKLEERISKMLDVQKENIIISLQKG